MFRAALRTELPSSEYSRASIDKDLTVNAHTCGWSRNAAENQSNNMRLLGLLVKLIIFFFWWVRS